MWELRRLVHPTDRLPLEHALHEHLAGRTPEHHRDYRIRHADGRWVWLEERASVVERDLNGAPSRVIGTCADVTDRVCAQQSAEWLALHDPLTSLPNRASFDRELRRSIQQAADRGAPIGLLLLDLDHFKWVNDRYGHQAGDQLLVHLGRRLRGSIRQADLVARFGGDEFAVIVTRQRQGADPGPVVERLLSRLRPPFEVHGQVVTVTASAGLAMHGGGLDGEQLVARADRALYEAKAAGRATWRRQEEPVTLPIGPGWAGRRMWPGS
jgi:diguanylate cyclase (GGDEF)-like protein